jgi:hypothetical protein
VELWVAGGRARAFGMIAWATAWSMAALVLACASAPAAPAPPTTMTWPHTFARDGATVTVYQPQAVSWPDRKTLTARAAVSILRPGQKTPILGTIELVLATTTDTATGVVHLADPKLLASHFPSLDTSQAASLQAKLGAALPGAMRTRAVPLEAVELSLKDVPVRSVTVDNTPPVIFIANRPASLVVFDGAPVLTPIGKTGLSFAVNTNWDVFALNGTWYLLANGLWLSAPAATGPYKPLAHLPSAFNALPKTADFAAVHKSMPAHPPNSAAAVPTIFVSEKPAEIIVTDGPPKFVPIPGTGLQRVTNTPSALFFDPAQGRFYVLFSGRWFAASGLDGPWTFATDSLPPDFALIPPKGPEGAVLASVPGTAAAEEAVLKAQIPTSATLKRDSVHPVVIYSGPPHFVPIAGTTLLYATNTAAVVLEVGPGYYVCQNGAWFVGATPTGPWVLADSVPAAIATIPPSFPFYNVTYVKVYAVTPTTVTYGYTAGYVMGFVSAGVLVYGTGYYYPPVILRGPVPIYYPYPYSYAGSVYYNSATGAWARGGTIYGPYATATGGRAYNPTTGAWARGGAIYGPYGGAGAWSAYNPSTGSYARGSAVWGNGSGSANASYYNARSGVSGSTNQNWNQYSRWGSSTFSGPNQTVHTQSRSNAQGSTGSFRSSTGAEGAGYHNRATGGSGGVVKGAGGDVYAGRDGNVYRHTDNGWQSWNNGGWNPVQRPSGGTGRLQGSSGDNYQQLQRDRLGRQAGEGRFGGEFGDRFGGGGGRGFRR